MPNSPISRYEFACWPFYLHDRLGRSAIGRGFEIWPTGDAIWLLALIGVGGTPFGAQLLMTHAYGGPTVPEAAIWQQLKPVMSYLWALALLDERLALLETLGVVLGIAGEVDGSVMGQREHGETSAARDVQNEEQ